MAEEIDLGGLLNEGGTHEEPERFPVPGGHVDLVPIPATINVEGVNTDPFTVKLKSGGTWGFCPFGLFVTDAHDSIAKTEFDGLIPYKRILGIVYHYDEFKQWESELKHASSGA